MPARTPDDELATSPHGDLVTSPASLNTEPIAGGAGDVAITYVPAPTSTHRYQLGPRIARGGMGEIMLARDTQIGRDVAIKRVSDKASRARFLREARIQGRLDHPAIVPVHELAVDDTGRPFFVMKRLAGTTLRAVLVALARGDRDAAAKYPRQRLLRAVADICLAVEFAHSRGVIHRDLKPDNVMLGDFGEVWLLDWGVARLLGDDDVSTGPGSSPPDSETQDGTVLGTPGYLSPEQLRGDPTLDHRTDVFALGCILYEVLAGTPLLPRGRDPSVYASLDARPSRHPSAHDIAPELDALCVDATQLDRDHRPASARELGERLQRYLDGDRDVSLRRQLAADHVAAARVALNRGDTAADRRTAMQQAGRALALDPTLPDAAELVGRLMLDPPRELPAEVAAELEQIDHDTSLNQNRSALFAFAVSSMFIPVLALLGASPWYLIAIAALLLGGSVIAWTAIRNSPRAGTPLFVASIVLNAALIATFSRLCTPFLVAPGLAAVAAVAYAVNPKDGKTWVLITVFSAAVLVPWILEVAGVVSRTMAEVGNALVLTPPGMGVHHVGTELAMAAFTIGLVIGCAVSVRSIANAQRASRRAQQLQAWHLRQLVPIAT